MAAVHAAAAMNHVLAMEYHSVDVPWWQDMVTGLPKPLIRNGFIQVPDGPGLGFEDINEEVVRAHINPNIPGLWESTDQWTRSFQRQIVELGRRLCILIPEKKLSS